MVTEQKIGILGGGQLGKMLCEAAAPWHLDISILDQSPEISAAKYCTNFVQGSFKNYKDVFNFGKDLDILTIEIEHVNLEALSDLESIGVKVYPGTETLSYIVDKGLQKSFYADNELPTSPFILLESKAQILEAITSGRIQLPFVQKARKEGYDGRGVETLRTIKDLDKLMDVPSVIEELVKIKHEVAVITARNPRGQLETYDPVEMIFQEDANILDVLISPAQINKFQSDKMKAIAETLAEKLNLIGVLAVEFFIDEQDSIFINECAPRPHNSGHQSIENNLVSQYEQHLRAILDWPLVTPSLIKPAVMVNVLGEAKHSGKAEITGKKVLLEKPGTYFHWYGKKDCKPYRKMGHITIIQDKLVKALEIAKELKEQIKVIAK